MNHFDAFFYWSGVAAWVIVALVTLIITAGIWLIGDAENYPNATIREDLARFNNNFALWQANRRHKP